MQKDLSELLHSHKCVVNSKSVGTSLNIMLVWNYLATWNNHLSMVGYQLDDSKSLHGKCLFHQTSIKTGCLEFQVDI